MSFNQQEAIAEQDDMMQNLYLTFTLSEQVFGLIISSVTEIIGMQSITTLTDVPNYVKGIINLRGKIIPVIDGRLKLKMPEIEYNERTCIIIIISHGSYIGLIVDSVSEVITIDGSNIVPPPDLYGGTSGNNISGIGKALDKIILILDSNKLLKEDEILEICNS